MFPNFNRVVVLIALLLFGQAQYRGWNLFDETADSHSGGHGSGRVYCLAATAVNAVPRVMRRIARRGDQTQPGIQRKQAGLA